MIAAAPYFENHIRARRFPWSIYHGALEADLARFLSSLGDPSGGKGRGGPRVLVIGCGLLSELDRAPQRIRITAVDVDERAVASARALNDPRLSEALRIDEAQPLHELGRFDAIYAKEVIEHIPRYQDYLAGLGRALATGGRIWLSTPNYGEPWLPAIEYTFLELVARRGGYSRFGMHPSKFSARRLGTALSRAGFTQVRVRPVALRLALVAEARVPG